MLPNPLTPPAEDSAPAIDIDNGVSLTPSPLTPISQNGSPISPPGSNTNMELDSTDSLSGSHNDDDMDMSDGGAPLVLTLSHIEALNHEMDILDAEVMGEENLMELFDSTPFTSNFTGGNASIFDSLTDDDMHPESLDGANETMEAYEYHTGGDVTLQTAVMTVISQQQHMQNGQEHTVNQAAQEEEHNHAFQQHHSTTPFHFPSISSQDHVSSHSNIEFEPFMTDVTAANSTSAAIPLALFNQLETPAEVDGHFQGETLGTETDADEVEVEEQFNYGLADFLYHWSTLGDHPEVPRGRLTGPSLVEVHRQRSLQTLDPVKRADLQGEKCDIQRINWEELGVTRLEAKQMRRRTYHNYTNLRFTQQFHPRLHGAQLNDDQNFFRFRRMDFDHNIHISHFQLRNLISCASKDHVFYAARHKIMQWNPTSGTPGPKKPVMDLKHPTVQPLHSNTDGILVSTLTLGHNILVAGGFSGEYALVNLRARKNTKHSEGIITEHVNSITNHAQVSLSRTSLAPQVVFASNDNGVRVLDVGSNTFIADYTYDHAINCTAISPDQRLRVMVGDTQDVMICNAETGEVLQRLEGHRDFGFACDWADDGWTVATGNQDMQIKIWDARKWTNSSGQSCAVTTVAADMAGVRKLKFSPVGSGKRVLVAAEPADFINIIDAETFSTKQTLSFFGDIGGFDFTNGGRDLIVANCDSMRGGLMEYERCDLARVNQYDVNESRRHRRTNFTGYDWRLTDEETTEHPNSYGTLESRRRRATIFGPGMDHF